MNNELKMVSQASRKEYPEGLVLWIILNERLFDVRHQFLTHGRVMFYDRIGADMDQSLIEEALEPFNVDVRKWYNMTISEILDALDKVKKEADNNPTKFAGFVFLGMSHGFGPQEKDYLVTSDCKILDLQYVTERFHNFQCVGLKDKPKCFIFNMCRGTTANMESTEHIQPCIDMDRAIKALQLESDSADAYNTPGLAENVQGSGKISFKKGDYAIVYSTMSGFSSHRHREFGSPFIQELAAGIKRSAVEDNADYEEILRDVRSATAKHQYSGSNAPQLPELVSTLREKFILPAKSK
jgi:hypothetical protein